LLPQKPVLTWAFLKRVQFVTRTTIVDVSSAYQTEPMAAPQRIYNMLSWFLTSKGANRVRIASVRRSFAIAPDRMNLTKPFYLWIMSE
jgi:hypothetical protein